MQQPQPYQQIPSGYSQAPPPYHPPAGHDATHASFTPAQPKPDLSAKANTSTKAANGVGVGSSGQNSKPASAPRPANPQRSQAAEAMSVIAPGLVPTPRKPTKGYLDGIKQFATTVYQNGYGYADLVNDELQMDPGSLQLLFTELGLPTASRAKNSKQSEPAPPALASSGLAAITESSSASNAAETQPQPSAPLDRKDYIARLMAAKAKKDNPSPATDAVATAEAAAAKRPVDLSEMREKALKSARAAQTARQFNQQEDADVEMLDTNPEQDEDMGDGYIRLPGLYMTKPSNEAEDNSDSGMDVDKETSLDGSRLGAPPLGQRATSSSSIHSLTNKADNTELNTREMEIRQMKLKLKLLEAKAKAKAANKGRTPSLAPTSVAEALNAPGSATPVLEAEPEVVQIVRPDTAAVAIAVESAGSGTPMTPDTALALPGLNLKRKREDVESELSASKIRATSTTSRMDALRAQMRELEMEALREEEDRARLAKELEDFGVDTANIPAEKLQETRDAVVADMEAKAAAVPAVEVQHQHPSSDMDEDSPEQEHDASFESGQMSPQLENNDADADDEESVEVVETTAADEAALEEYDLDIYSPVIEEPDSSHGDDHDEHESVNVEEDGEIHEEVMGHAESDDEDDYEPAVGDEEGGVDLPDANVEPTEEPQTPQLNDDDLYDKSDSPQDSSAEEGEVSDTAHAAPTHQEEQVLPGLAPLPGFMQNQNHSKTQSAQSNQSDDRPSIPGASESGEVSESSQGNKEPQTQPMKESRMVGPFADESSEDSDADTDGEWAGPTEANNEHVSMAAQGDDMDDYEPPEVGLVQTPGQAPGDAEDDDYEPPEAESLYDRPRRCSLQ